MRYFSPLLLIDLPPAASYDKKDILLAKKKLLAELELAGSTTITIRGKELSKNDILTLFDKLGNDTELPYHALVAADLALLAFLQMEEPAGPIGNFCNEPLYASNAFIDWISPYFSQAFAAYAVSYFDEREVDALQSLLKTAWMMNASHQEKSWAAIEGILEAHIEEMKQLQHEDPSNKNGLDFISHVELLCDHTFINMVLQLPEERFGMVRDELAYNMMQLLILVFNTGKWENQAYSRNTMGNAKLVAYRQSLQAQIQEKQDEMESLIQRTNAPYSSSNGDSSSFPWKQVLFFIVIVLRLAYTCSGPSSNRSITSEWYNESYKDILAKYQQAERDRSFYTIVDNYGYITDTRHRALALFVKAIKNAALTAVADTVAPKAYQTGIDPYKKIWKNKLFARKGAAKPEQAYQIQNGSGADGVFFIWNANKVFSVFVKAGDVGTVKLAEGENKIYLYMGQQFDPTVKIDFNVNGFTEVTGLFIKGTYLNNKFLSNAVTQQIDHTHAEKKFLKVVMDSDGTIDYAHSDR